MVAFGKSDRRAGVLALKILQGSKRMQVLKLLLAVVIGTGIGIVGHQSGLLPGLPVAMGTSEGEVIPPFSIEAYMGDGWADLDQDCQDSRTEALLALGLNVQLDEAQCTVVSGEWRDEYTGEIITDLNSVKVEHAVPLEAAHQSGAHKFSRKDKKELANKFVRPELLVVTPRSSLATNLIITRGNDRQNRDISEWQPERFDARCRYAQRWLNVKTFWQLSITEDEREVLENILRGCV